MPNLEEGFRRIGTVIMCTGIILGIIAFANGAFLLGFLIAVGVVFVGHVLLFVTAYVIKGFMKQSNEEKDKV
jgi:hypothetical protein